MRQHLSTAGVCKFVQIIMAVPVEASCLSPESYDLFYEKAKSYWSKIDPSLNGVLGGFGWISSADVRGSNNFLLKVFKEKDGLQNERALDCGAGIGRVTKEVLLRHFKSVDMVELNNVFLAEAKRSLLNENKVKHYYECSLRDFEPTEMYDVIWCQWVLGHLTDLDLIAFLRRCSRALRPFGMIIIKENISGDGVVEDEVDSSVTRPTDHFTRIFRQASLRVVRQAVQTNFPSQLFSVKIFALRPVSTTTSVSELDNLLEKT